MLADCDRCALRDIACLECVITVIPDGQAGLGPEEIRALRVLADAGLVPPLRFTSVTQAPVTSVTPASLTAGPPASVTPASVTPVAESPAPVSPGSGARRVAPRGAGSRPADTRTGRRKQLVTSATHVTRFPSGSP